jgi:predicted enzyme related to lactoylglutathione lyase
MAGKVVHFEIPFDDAERARRFYEDALEWQVEQFGDMAYFMTRGEDSDGMGSDGALAERDADLRTPLLYIAVADIDASLARIRAGGGEPLTDRIPIPGMGWWAAFRDTEGNRMGLFQHDPSVEAPSQ